MTEEETRLEFMAGQIDALTSYLCEVLARLPADQAAHIWDNHSLSTRTILENRREDAALDAWRAGIADIKQTIGDIMPEVRARLPRRPVSDAS